MKLPLIPANLPCDPCPHSGACCAWGTELSPAEAKGLAADYGDDKVFWNGEAHRTTIGPHNRCSFHGDDGKCIIHAHPLYPAVCKGFPHSNEHGNGPYEADLSICPEINTPS